MATKQELEARVAELEAQLASGTGDAVTTLSAEVEVLKQRNSELELIVEAAANAPTATPCPQGDHVVVDGKLAKVVMKDSLKYAWESARKRFVDENLLCLVLDIENH